MTRDPRVEQLRNLLLNTLVECVYGKRPMDATQLKATSLILAELRFDLGPLHKALPSKPAEEPLRPLLH